MIKFTKKSTIQYPKKKACVAETPIIKPSNKI